MAVDFAPISGGKASGVFRQFRGLIHIHTAQDSLIASRGEGVRNPPSYPPAPGVAGRIGQADAVARIGGAEPRPGIFLDGEAGAVQPGVPSESARLGC